MKRRRERERERERAGGPGSVCERDKRERYEGLNLERCKVFESDPWPTSLVQADMFNNSSKERRSSGDDGFAVFQNGKGRNKERPSVVPSAAAAPASAALHFRGTMDNNSTYPDDGTCLFARGVGLGVSL
jgi:hypothetical protein